jgi:hypothetical protein
LKKEELMKKELNMRLAVAGFLQETLQELASKRAKSSEANEVLSKFNSVYCIIYYVGY